MRKELSDDYEIDVNNMIDMTGPQVNGFELFEGEFYSFTDNMRKKRMILRKDPYNYTGPVYHVEDGPTIQIFQMKDGKFIQEVAKFDDEYGETVSYYYSDDLTDLI